MLRAVTIVILMNIVIAVRLFTSVDQSPYQLLFTSPFHLPAARDILITPYQHFTSC
jgi:hypothetical protein